MNFSSTFTIFKLEAGLSLERILPLKLISCDIISQERYDILRIARTEKWVEHTINYNQWIIDITG